MKKLIKMSMIAFVLGLSLVLLQGHSASAQGTTTYVVQPGDSMWKIAVKHQIGLSEIIQANPQIHNPHFIYPQQRLNIPNIDNIKSIEQRVIQLTNQERAKHGLRLLQEDWEVSRVARYKSEDMRDNSYFSHQSHIYGSPFQMLRSFDVQFRAAGENIAMGQRTADEVVRAWMNSPGHRQNILSPNYTHIGVGYAEGGSGRYYWTQMFISK